MKSKEEYYQDALREEGRIFREQVQLVLFGVAIGFALGIFFILGLLYLRILFWGGL